MKRLLACLTSCCFAASPLSALEPPGIPSPGPVAPVRSVGDWIHDLRNGDDNTRVRAANALAELGTKAQGAMVALVAALDDPASQVARAAAVALGAIGPAARDAGAALLRAMIAKARADDRSFVGDAGTAIGRIGAPEIGDAARLLLMTPGPRGGGPQVIEAIP